MNILPKKSWHVRTKKNIERVRKDEAEAERLARIEQDKKLEVEHEIRVRELRARAGLKEPEQRGHINLFAGCQDRKQESNKDHEEEKREEESKWLQRAGISNKLGKPQDVNKPWYCIDKPGTSRLLQHPGCLPIDCAPISSRSTVLDLDCKDRTQTDKRIVRSNLITSIYDPLTAIKDAERIIREKRVRKKEQERSRQIEENRKHLTQLRDYDFYRLTRPPQLPLVPASFRPPAPALQACDERLIEMKAPQSPVASIAETDSSYSPEIIKIVRVNQDKKRKRKRKKTKKEKREKDSSRTKKHHKHHRHKSKTSYKT